MSRIGVALTCANFSTPPHNRAYEMHCYLPPFSGAFSASWTGLKQAQPPSDAAKLFCEPVAKNCLGYSGR